MFDPCYASHEIGIAKPSDRFFLHILQKEGKDATRTFFIDDTPEHVDAARGLGIHAYRYEPFTSSGPWTASLFT